MEHVSTVLAELRAEMAMSRDNEIQGLAYVLPQYITDSNDTAAFRAVDRQVNQFARAWDKMIARLEKWEQEAAKIEASCENFYGD